MINSNDRLPVIVVGPWLPYYKEWIAQMDIIGNAKLAEAFQAGWNTAAELAIETAVKMLRGES